MSRPYPGLSAATPDLNKMMPALNKMIQGQTGQENDVVLNPAPRDVLRIVEAIGSSGLCKIGVTCQDAVEYDEDGRMQTLGTVKRVSVPLIRIINLIVCKLCPVTVTSTCKK